MILLEYLTPWSDKVGGLIFTPFQSSVAFLYETRRVTEMLIL